MIGKLIWRNLWRNKRRTLITTSSATFAVLLAVVTQALVKGTFGNNCYVSASYLYNSPGHAVREFRNPLLSLPVPAKQLLPFEHTFYAGFNKAFSPITGLNVSFLYSPYYNTLVFFPAFTGNVAIGFDLDLTVQSFVNEDGEAWRMQGNAVYLRIRWS